MDKQSNTTTNVELKANALPVEIRIQKTLDKSFNEFGFLVKLTSKHWMAFYVHSGLMSGTFEDRSNFLNEYKPIAYSFTELGKGWDIYGEPTGPGQLGITIYTSKGKAIAAGTGKISKEGDFSFAVATLYKGITNKGKIEYKVEGTGKSDGSWQVTGSVSYTKD